MCQSPFHTGNSPEKNQFCKISHFACINPEFFSENASVGITRPLTSGSSHICSSFFRNIEKYISVPRFLEAFTAPGEWVLGRRKNG